MNRRSFLASLGAGGIAANAGCVGVFDGRVGDAEVSSEAGPVSTGGHVPPPRRDVDLPLSESAFVRAAPRDGIPAITDPVFGTDWSGVRIEVDDSFRGRYVSEPRLRPWDPVIGVERAGETRAYPLKLLNWHEVVNDEFDGPIVVTFCPLCNSAVVADRRVDDSPVQFGVSGLLWEWDLVLYDRETESLWSQILATAVRGPLTGTELTILPSSVTRWESWLSAHPDTTVLRPPPESKTVDGASTFDYGHDRYGAYRASAGVGVVEEEFEDGRLHPKMVVLGLAVGDDARAYPASELREVGVVNDRVGGVPVVVASGPDDPVSALDGSLFAYDRRVDDRVLDFTSARDRHLRGAGSRWDVVTGEAVDGPHAGRQLGRLVGQSMFWFAWLTFHPETTVWRPRSAGSRDP